ncbi:hypothetical protein EG68_06382 [Paragonimus skrjabini miyazakii]|uniref:Uncharacterized protein n=1 Tax=Paragonimus skrjabini miyazakii TaxID=59628 RepID=A0A8S9YRR6_9TREM|nr:hypothetical protein EG68_06382 [Paragonimus skrjabini miyazakii]
MDCDRIGIVTAQHTNRSKSNTASPNEYRSNRTDSYEAIHSLQGQPNRAFLLRALACRNSHPVVTSSSPIAQSRNSRTSSITLSHSRENSTDQAWSGENSIKQTNSTNIPTHYGSRIRRAFGEVPAITDCNRATQAEPNRSAEIRRSVTILSPSFGKHKSIKQPSAMWRVSPSTSDGQPRSEMIKLLASSGTEYAKTDTTNFHSTYLLSRPMNTVEKMDIRKPDRLNAISSVELTEKSISKLPRAYTSSLRIDTPAGDKSGPCTQIWESQSGQRIPCNEPQNWSVHTMQEKAIQTNVENSVQYTESVISPDQKSNTCEVELQCRLPFSNHRIAPYGKTISSAEGWRHIPFTYKVSSTASGKKKLSLQAFLRCIRGNLTVAKRTRLHAQTIQEYDPPESRTHFRCSKRTRRLIPSDLYLNTRQLRAIRKRIVGLNEQQCRGVEVIESKFTLIHSSLDTLGTQLQAITTVLNEQNGLVQELTRVMETLPTIWTNTTVSNHTIRRYPSSSSLIQRCHSTMSKRSTEQPSRMNPKLTRSDYSIYNGPVQSSLYQKSNLSHYVRKRLSFAQRPASVSTQRTEVRKIVNQPGQLQPTASSEECTLITERITADKHSDDSTITANSPLRVPLTRTRNNSITSTGKSALPNKATSETTVSNHDAVDECMFDINPTDLVSSSPISQCSSPPTLPTMIEGPPSKSVTDKPELQRYYKIAFVEPEKRPYPQNLKGTNQKSVGYRQGSYVTKTNQKHAQTFCKATATRMREAGQLLTTCKRSEKSPTTHSHKETIGKIHKAHSTTICSQKLKAGTGSSPKIRRCERTSTPPLETASNIPGEQNVPFRPSTRTEQWNLTESVTCFGDVCDPTKSTIFHSGSGAKHRMKPCVISNRRKCSVAFVNPKRVWSCTPETDPEEPNTQPQACERSVGKSQSSTISYCQPHSTKHRTSTHRHEKHGVSRRDVNTISFNPKGPQACLLSSGSRTVQWTNLSDQLNNNAETEDRHNAEQSVEPTTCHSLKRPIELAQIPFSELRATQPAKLSFVTAQSFRNRNSLPGLTSDCSKPTEYALPEPVQSVKFSFTTQKLSKRREAKRLEADKQLYEELLSLKQNISKDKSKVPSNSEEKEMSSSETANLSSNCQPEMEHNGTETTPNVSDKSESSGEISPTTVDYKERRRKRLEAKAAEDLKMILAMTEEAALERRDRAARMQNRDTVTEARTREHLPSSQLKEYRPTLINKNTREIEGDKTEHHESATELVFISPEMCSSETQTTAEVPLRSTGDRILQTNDNQQCNFKPNIHSTDSLPFAQPWTWPYCTPPAYWPVMFPTPIPFNYSFTWNHPPWILSSPPVCNCCHNQLPIVEYACHQCCSDKTDSVAHVIGYLRPSGHASQRSPSAAENSISETSSDTDSRTITISSRSSNSSTGSSTSSSGSIRNNIKFKPTKPNYEQPVSENEENGINRSYCHQVWQTMAAQSCDSYRPNFQVQTFCPCNQFPGDYGSPYCTGTPVYRRLPICHMNVAHCPEKCESGTERSSGGKRRLSKGRSVRFTVSDHE